MVMMMVVMMARLLLLSLLLLLMVLFNLDRMQLLTFGGFYDTNLEFLRLEKVQVRGTASFIKCSDRTATFC
jgi:hypothetical protein